MGKQFLSDIDLNNTSRVINSPNPTAPQHAATKAYVDSIVEGLQWKDNVRVATQSNLNLAAPGATIDGVTMASNDRVLVKNQTLPEANGIYIWNGAAVAMTRSADTSTADELENAISTVDEGTSAGTSYRQSAVNFVLGTGPISWTEFGTVTPQATETVAGKAEIATQAEVDGGTDDSRFITPLKLENYSKKKLKFGAQFGDGTATQYDFTHNFNTFDLNVEVFRNSGSRDTIMCDVSRPDANTVRLNFSAAPTSNQFRVVILG